MEKIDKKKLANEKRLKAVQEWQKNKNRNAQFPKLSLGTTPFSPKENKSKVFDSDDLLSTKKSQLKLFDSDEEEDFGDCFKIRPQFEGKNGQHMLEISSELTDRFKLDERFQDGEEQNKEEEEEDPEKGKNIRILESILGHEVSKKHPIAVNSRIKREIKRFDPEDENGMNCIKVVENVQKKSQKKNRKNESFCNEEIPYSSERYIEVTTNLKDIMSSASNFSFTEKFNLHDKIKDVIHNGKEYTSSTFERNTPCHNRNDMEFNNKARDIQRGDFECSTSFKDPFFISDTDERLQEGINFFMRPKPLDEIREEWLKKQSEVLDIFKRRRKSAEKGSARRPKKHSQRQRKINK